MSLRTCFCVESNEDYRVAYLSGETQIAKQRRMYSITLCKNRRNSNIRTDPKAPLIWPGITVEWCNTNVTH